MRRRHELLACTALAALTALVYAPVRSFPFISYDDPFYIAQNPHIAQGLSLAGLRWAMWNNYYGNWLPLTWLSHLADYEFFGVRPGPHHVVSALLHVANALLLFLLLARATGCFWRAAVAAALFALHPLRVESVAWVSERKDVLSGLFFLLTLIAYVGYARRRGIGRYVWVTLAFAAALMSKPMVVTLPLVLLLLDFWPLRRGWAQRRRIVLEKVPLLAMAAALCVATVVAQQRAGAVKGAERYTMTQRLGNAAVSYVRYVEKNVWPRGLAVFYPHPGTWPAWQVLGAAAVLAGVTFAAWRARQRAPYLLVGWLWFAGTLVPVIGIVQVGDQSMADRYTYLPSIGLIIAIVWGAADVCQRFGRNGQVAGACAAACAILALCLVTSRQLRHWQGGTLTLFQHAAAVTQENWLAHGYVGSELVAAGEVERGTAHFRQALRIRPGYALAHYNLGNALLRLGRADDAIEQYRAALQRQPALAEAWANLGAALARQERYAQALEAYEQALRHRPDLLHAQQGLQAARARLRAPTSQPAGPATQETAGGGQ